MTPSTRYAAAVEYDGGGFFGFQRQKQEPTVQSVLEKAIGNVANHAVTVHGSGRTDTGVHASGQVIHFDSPAARQPRNWLLGINANLPEGCVIRWIVPVDSEFHARFSATARRYRYTIVNRDVRPVLTRHITTWIRPELDIDAIRQAAAALVGEHDFNAFRASSCQADHAVRRIHSIEITQQSPHVLVDIEGNAFLHHMVRNIVGSLMLVGKREQSTEWMAEILASRDRRKAGPTAPATGLCLTHVRYPAAFGLPQ